MPFLLVEQQGLAIVLCIFFFSGYSILHFAKDFSPLLLFPPISSVESLREYWFNRRYFIQLSIDCIGSGLSFFFGLFNLLLWRDANLQEQFEIPT